MQGNPDRVVVGLSGGVDSAVAALLLKRQGYDVVGVFMRNWEEEDDQGACTSDEDYAEVRSVCDTIGIPYYTVNFSKQYWDRVFTYFIEEYRLGRTPNPDVLCNKEIKFKEFLSLALKIDAAKLATGHYAQTGERDGLITLLKGVDPGKDQTYFLHTLGQYELSHAMFPIGGMLKQDVRALARDAGLSNAQRKDSTGICFIGERHFKTFLQQYLPACPGEMRALDGTVVGRHDGLMYYTLGQRKGLGIGGGGNGLPWFVVDKDIANNVLWITQGDDHEKLYSRGCDVGHLSWVSGHAPGMDFLCKAKMRYRQPDQSVHVEITQHGAKVMFDEPQRAVTLGQYAVFYRGELCLGGGSIERIIR